MGLFDNTLQNRLDSLNAVANQVRTVSQNFGTITDASVSSSAVLQLLQRLVSGKAQLASFLGDNQLQTYAREQTLNNALVLDNVIAGISASIDAVVSAIASVYPKDGTGYLLEKTVAADGSINVRAFNRADLINVFAACATLANGIQ